MTAQYTVQNVFVSAVTPDNISRQSLLAWVNDQLQSHLNKIEEMSTGAAYCQLTDRLFPGSVQLKKVKWNSRNEVDWINNWRVLQKAWGTLGIDKPVNVQTLMRAKFQDNFEFLQWFRKFYDANNVGYEYDPLAARGGEEFPLSSGRPGVRAPPVRSVPSQPRRSAAAAAPLKPVSARTAPTRPATTAVRSSANAASPIDPHVETSLRKEVEQLKGQIAEYERSLDELTNERDYYYQRLCGVEEMCTAQGEQGSVEVQRILAILYQKEGEQASDDQASDADHSAAHTEIIERASNATETLDRAPSAAALAEEQDMSQDEPNVTQEIVAQNGDADHKDLADGVQQLEVNAKVADQAPQKASPGLANGGAATPEEF